MSPTRVSSRREVPVYPPCGDFPLFYVDRPLARFWVHSGDAVWLNHAKCVRLTSWVLNLKGASLTINQRAILKYLDAKDSSEAKARVNCWAGFIEGTKGVPQVRTVEA